ncbi:hypothetical protein CALVIDRAFT_540360 [Calocera viscosa TUFC12733]|uniref:EXPERA domain-containing protein n=1 Tax=Calocera viscosa (strain TUFC12733) TaxID=1330018 RepID=A0A167IZQ0_CALVF|nr:hypothetical protein CALVIDRAFT_540360 [Calocera viscosa TUFC12733]
MSRPSTTMRIDTLSVTFTLLSCATCFASYLVYSLALRKERPSPTRLVNELAALWLSYDALTHAVVVAVGMASGLPTNSSSSAPMSARMTLVWQNFAQQSQSLLPADVIAQIAVTLACPLAGYAALMWWRDQRRWREGEIAAAVLDIFATVLGFMRFRPERLRDMSPERREAAFQTWAAFFFLNMLWVVIPAAMLYYNFNALQQEHVDEDGKDQKDRMVAAQ